MKTTSFSIYDRPDVQQQIAQQREELEARGIEPYGLIGAAYTPRNFDQTPSDQAWVQALLLR